eukprot:COSAG04_NODE_12674_length_640_cov_0.985213_1_plen_67_part_10
MHSRAAIRRMVVAVIRKHSPMAPPVTRAICERLRIVRTRQLKVHFIDTDAPKINPALNPLPLRDSLP